MQSKVKDQARRDRGRWDRLGFGWETTESILASAAGEQ
jgi:hypothetical protein